MCCQELGSFGAANSVGLVLPVGLVVQLTWTTGHCSLFRAACFFPPLLRLQCVAPRCTTKTSPARRDGLLDMAETLASARISLDTPPEQ